MMFNTLGNLAADPRAGLLLVDFEGGGTLQLTGRATIEWDPAALGEFPGAERLVELRSRRWWRRGRRDYAASRTRIGIVTMHLPTHRRRFSTARAVSSARHPRLPLEDHLARKEHDVREFVLTHQRIAHNRCQLSREPCVSIGAYMGEFDSVWDFLRLRKLPVKAVRTAVQGVYRRGRIGAVIQRGVIGFAIKGELPARDAVCIAPNDRPKKESWVGLRTAGVSVEGVKPSTTSLSLPFLSGTLID